MCSKEKDLENAKIVWDYMVLHQPLTTADVLVVLGSIDTRVADYAADLWHKKVAPVVVCSGGIAHGDDLLATHWEKPEAEVFGAILQEKGVPAHQIHYETRALNTGDNAQFSYQVLVQKGIPTNSVLVVTKPYMERRAYATFKKQWPDVGATVTVTSPPIAFDDYFNDEQPFKKIVTIMLGDLDRIPKYATLGFQIPQEVPSEVWEAHAALLQSGYGGHVTKDKEGNQM